MYALMIKTLCMGICRASDDCSLLKIVIYISSQVLVRLLQETTITQGLPLKVAHIILGRVLSMLLSDFKVGKLRIISTPPMATLTEFFHADRETNIHPLLVLCYF